MCTSVSLQSESYTIKNALFWGNCKEHYKNTFSKTGSLGSRIVHLILAILETLPLISQIISLFEMLIAKCCASSSNHARAPVISTPQTPVPSKDQLEKYNDYAAAADQYRDKSLNPCKIYFKSLSGKTYTVNVHIKHQDLKWGHLKYLLTEQIPLTYPQNTLHPAIAMDCIGFIFNGRQHSDDSIVQSRARGVSSPDNESIIHIIQTLKGINSGYTM